MASIVKIPFSAVAFTGGAAFPGVGNALDSCRSHMSWRARSDGLCEQQPCRQAFREDHRLRAAVLGPVERAALALELIILRKYTLTPPDFMIKPGLGVELRRVDYRGDIGRSEKALGRECTRMTELWPTAER